METTDGYNADFESSDSFLLHLKRLHLQSRVIPP